MSLDETLVVVQNSIDRILASIAIIFACVQFVDSRRQRHRMNEIAKSMSTRFVGVFPKNMGDVIEVVGKSSQSVDIMIDICAYGHYSYPEFFMEYSHALESLSAKGEGVTVRMIVYDQARAAQDQDDVFYNVPGFFEREVTSKRFEKFFKLNRGWTEPTTEEGLKEVLFSEQAIHQDNLRRKGVEIRTISETMLLFMWLSDRQEAVFSFRSEKGERELSFRTRDGNLLVTMGDVFEQVWRKAKPLGNLAASA